MTGIICPVEREAKPFLNEMRVVSTSAHAMLDIREGFVGGERAALAVCGVCKVNAAAAAQILIDRFNAARVIVSGTAGGIDPALDVGDTVVVTETAYYDVEPDILTQNHPYLKDAVFKSDAGLLARVREILSHKPPGHPIWYGRAVTGESFIVAEGRAGIIQRLNPLCVDMETAAAAHVCHVNGIPFLAVRSITDTERDLGMDAFYKNAAMASARSYMVVKALLEDSSC